MLNYIEIVKEKIKEDIKEADKRGTITLPRGLSDEELIEAYHDEARNSNITEAVISEMAEVYRALERYEEECITTRFGEWDI